MISKTALRHTLVIWALVQVTTALSRGSIPAGVRSSMIANGWRPLTNYEGGKNGGQLPAGPSGGSGGVSPNERNSGSHPVHGKLHDHMATLDKLMSKKKKNSHDYNPPSILGSFSVFGHSMSKVRGGSESPMKAQQQQQQQQHATSETREYSFLVPPPPRESVRYEMIDPYRKIILRDNEPYMRQPQQQQQQYIFSHPGSSVDFRNGQYFGKGGGVSASASTQNLISTKSRPIISDYTSNNNKNSGQQPPTRQQNIPFESLKISNSKVYLQPPSANSAPLTFGHHETQQQATENLYDRYPSPPHSPQLNQEGNFYSQINHPSPSYKSPNLDRDPSFLVHESHELSYATPSAPSGPGGTYGNFRPSSHYENLHPPERYSTPRPASAQSDKFLPSKADNTRHQNHNQPQQSHNYAQYNPNVISHNLENSIVSEPNFLKGIANTYFISEHQSLTPPAPTWSAAAKTKVTADINEVLPKVNRPLKFHADSSQAGEGVHQPHVPAYLFPRPEIQQQQQPLQLPQHNYATNPLALINQPETTYETPESISLKHFNEQQYRLQQQLLQRDRERLREQELQNQQQQIELGRIAATREREKTSTEAAVPTQDTPRPTVEYLETTVTYVDYTNNKDESQNVRKVPGQHYEYQQVPYQPQRPEEPSVTHEVENVSLISDVFGKVTQEPEKTVTFEPTSVEVSPSHRNRLRKPPASNEQHQQQQQHRRRKPTISTYEEQNYRQEEQHHLSTLAPNPIVQSPGTVYYHSTSEPSTEGVQATYFPTTLPTSSTSTSTTTTTQKPRSRRPSNSGTTSGRRRRPSTTTTTTTQEPETTTLPVSYYYNHEDSYKDERIITIKNESESTRGRKRKPISTQTYQEPTETTTEKETSPEIQQNYGHKFGVNEQDYVTIDPEASIGQAIEHVSPQHTYGQDSLFYTPTYDSQVTTAGQVSTDYYETSSGYPTSPSSTAPLQRGGAPARENVDNADSGRDVFTNTPLEESFVNSERITTSPAPVASSSPATTTGSSRTQTFVSTRTSPSRTTTPAAIGSSQASGDEVGPTTRSPAYRMRPMRYGNTTRPRFSIKDYKSRLDYRNRITTSSETPSVTTRQKSGSSKLQQESENPPVESTTGRYRHMSRVSYRTTSTTPGYQSKRTESINSTTERVNKFAPKRRLHKNHLYRSKISTTTTVQPPDQNGDSGSGTTSGSTRSHSSVRNENIFSSSIRRRPAQMKASVFTQSSDVRTSTSPSRREPTEMVPEETSYYSPAISQQLLVTEVAKFNDDRTDNTIVKNAEQKDNFSNVSQTESSSSVEETTPHANAENVQQPVRSEDTSVYEYSQATTTSSPVNEAGSTEALVKESLVTVNSQLEEDLFARASQSVADLTSSASALYDKPGMFKAVSVAPSASEGSAIINSRFKISQDKPTLPIEAFFHELSNKN